MQRITYERKGGRAIFEGDIIIDERPGNTVNAASVGRESRDFRWFDRTIPYVIDPNLPSPSRVTSAIAHWEANTSIRFRPRTNEPDYVRFMLSPDAANCASFVGRRMGVQDVELGGECSVGTVIHEIGHVVGLFHEHTRSDRDGYVTVVDENILPGRAHNFWKRNTDESLNVGGYDYKSIMHYSPSAFSANGLPTIIRKDGGSASEMGQRNGLSNNDRQGVEYLYSRPNIIMSAMDETRCLEVAGGIPASQTPVQIWTCNGTTAQSWYRTAQRELRSALAPDLCLDVVNGYPTAGTRVQVYQCNGGLAQKWNIVNGRQLRSALGDSLCLDAINGDPTPGTKIQIWTCNSGSPQNWHPLHW
ncbi:M12 family metallopeptidase [Myxococcus hansupus]|uniref:M12 family metallopeptidase n=1 Tax=Pseudomyxococcus hansupus TaxID=1297742 RepID=UPI00131403A7|nr:M12 family metallopeptidase [Myxococcus hansupus]